MKILNFTPLKAPKESEAGRPKNRSSDSGGADFESVLKSVSGQPGGAASSTGAVGLENCRALKLPPPSELGMAGQLLSRLGADIRAASPEMLKSVHNLEGLIYVYNKNNV